MVMVDEPISNDRTNVIEFNFGMLHNIISLTPYVELEEYKLSYRLGTVAYKKENGSYVDTKRNNKNITV